MNANINNIFNNPANSHKFADTRDILNKLHDVLTIKDLTVSIVETGTTRGEFAQRFDFSDRLTHSTCLLKSEDFKRAGVSEAQVQSKKGEERALLLAVHAIVTTGCDMAIALTDVEGYTVSIAFAANINGQKAADTLTVQVKSSQQIVGLAGAFLHYNVCTKL